MYDTSNIQFHWLHQDTSIEEIRTRYFLKAPMSDWKFEAKIRFFPKNIEDLYESDAVTFKLLYHQVILSCYTYSER